MTSKARQPAHCKLCGQQAKLCRSHIVPEFCYTQVYEDGKARKIDLGPDGTGSIKTIQKGLRESMLCESCEACINKYERRFKTYWYDSPGLPEKIDLRSEWVRMAGAHYDSTKLFHLSVLWRAGMADCCKNVSLGPYSKKIGDMLLAGDPGSPQCFPVVGAVLINEDGTVNHRVITMPLPFRLGHSRAYY
ncbi:MAG TPA: hypothetical protein VMX14_11920, partial [Anaerolineae bacterium]|nr:hypothetical protein [Anaerolineae bacterium]